MMNYLISYICALLLFFCFGASADSKSCHLLRTVTTVSANLSTELSVKTSGHSINAESMLELNTDGNNKSNPTEDFSLEECDCNENDANDEGSSLSELSFVLNVPKPFYDSKIYLAPLEHPMEQQNPPPEIQ